MQVVNISCSRCGKHNEFDYSVSSVIDNVVKRGWNSCGGVLYCPDCVMFWKKVSPDRELGGAKNTIRVVDRLWEDDNRPGQWKC
ncbi:MAG: hypothetical protein Q4G33_06415 [bacterium]|nr:hypothetical protein [bacterium]